MDSQENVISAHDRAQFQKNTPGNKLQKLWEKVLNALPQHLKEEAKQKGFVLKKNPLVEDSTFAKYLLMDVPNASEELSEFLNKNIYPYVIELID